MAVDPLVKVQTALRNQVQRKLHSVADTQHAFTALLLALDNYYDTPGTRFIRADGVDAVQGTEIQIDFETALPVWAGVQHQAGALAAFAIAAAENWSMRGGKVGYSAYQGAETIRKSMLNRMARSPKSALPTIKKIASAMARSAMMKMDVDFFPAVNMVDNNTTYMHAENKVMAIAYPLQNPAAGVYEYAQIDLNAAGYTGIKAVVSGDTSGANAFGTPTPSNIRKKLLFPLQHSRQAKPDIGLCDSDVLDYMITNAEANTVIDMADKLKFGATLINCVGINWLPVDRLNVLAAAGGQKRELYILESEHHRFHSWGMGDDVDIEKIPFQPGLRVLQGYYEAAYVNDMPRNDARAVDVRLS